MTSSSDVIESAKRAPVHTPQSNFQPLLRRHAPVLGDVRDALGLVVGASDDSTHRLEELAFEVSEGRFERFLKVVAAPISDTKRAQPCWPPPGPTTCARCGANDERVTPWRGTAWGAAVNTYTQHEGSIQGADLVDGRAVTDSVESLVGAQVVDILASFAGAEE